MLPMLMRIFDVIIVVIVTVATRIIVVTVTVVMPPSTSKPSSRTTVRRVSKTTRWLVMKLMGLTLSKEDQRVARQVRHQRGWNVSHKRTFIKIFIGEYMVMQLSISKWLNFGEVKSLAWLKNKNEGLVAEQGSRMTLQIYQQQN